MARLGIGIGSNSINNTGAPANAWRYPNNNPVIRAQGGFWLKGS